MIKWSVSFLTFRYLTFGAEFRSLRPTKTQLAAGEPSSPAETLGKNTKRRNDEEAVALINTNVVEKENQAERENEREREREWKEKDAKCSKVRNSFFLLRKYAAVSHQRPN